MNDSQPQTTVRDQRASQLPAERQQSGAVDTSPPAVIARALAASTPIADLKELMAMQERWQATQARMAYVAAMADFKRNPPEIIKDKKVGYENNDGTFTGYKHATIGNVTSAICAGLAQHGFSHNWDVKQDSGQITVKCTITHALGHSESVQMAGGADDSGKKNKIQQVASTVTYLQRYTLLAATGLATQDSGDDDGAGGKKEFVGMSKDHQLTVTAKCEEISKTTLGQVLKSYKVKALAEIQDSEYDSIIHRLEITAKAKS